MRTIELSTHNDKITIKITRLLFNTINEKHFYDHVSYSSLMRIDELLEDRNVKVRSQDNKIIVSAKFT